jgi:cytosine/adenosine deaminase-related metal-dependent hydrolase
MHESSTAPVVTVRSRWCFPVDQPGWEHAWFSIQGGRIVDRGQGRPPVPAVDLGDVALIPGLINPHTHLEFSQLAHPLGQPGTPFPRWIAEVIRWRRSLTDDPAVAQAMKSAAIAKGLRESYEQGVCLIGEIASPHWEPWQYAHSLPSIRLFHEFLGLTPERSQFAWQQWEANGCEVLKTSSVGPSSVLGGISPHAPYTVSLADVGQLAQVSAKHRIPIAMHLAESPEEMEMLHHGTGPLVEMLESVGAWDASALSSNPSVLAYLKALLSAEVPQALIVHGNYLSEPDIQWLSHHRNRATVIFCPRTHAYFNHAEYPLKVLTSYGVPVALGTDSRASNPDLSPWREAQSVARLFPELSGERILEMVTRNGARALMPDRNVGDLAVGSNWTAAGIELGGHSLSSTDPLRELLEDEVSHPFPLWPHSVLERRPC